MKVYNGIPRSLHHPDYVVTVATDSPHTQRIGKLAPKNNLRNHSPDGFAWGYAGSGPSQLALALCADVFGDVVALRIYQQFKELVVTRWDADSGWQMTEYEIRAVMGQPLPGTITTYFTHGGVTSADAKAYTLQQLQDAVGGYIELVPTVGVEGQRVEYVGDLYVNEEGLIRDPILPYNYHASRLAHRALVGNAILVHQVPFQDKVG